VCRWRRKDPLSLGEEGGQRSSSSPRFAKKKEQAFDQQGKGSLYGKKFGAANTKRREDPLYCCGAIPHLHTYKRKIVVLNKKETEGGSPQNQTRLKRKMGRFSTFGCAKRK